MKLRKLFSKKPPVIHQEEAAEEGAAKDAAATLPSPAPSPTPDFAKIQTLGKKLMGLCAKRGEPVEDILEGLVTSYEDGVNAAGAAPAAPANPDASIKVLDGFAQMCSVLTDTFTAMDGLKSSLAESLVPDGGAQEASFIDDLAELGIGPEQIQGILAKMGQQKPGAESNPNQTQLGGGRYHG